MTKIHKALTPTEAQEHTAVVVYVQSQYGTRCRVMHAMNEGKRGWKSQAALKTHGVSKGFPDLQVFDRETGRVLFLELKRTKGSSTSPEQKDWIAWLKAAGFAAHICKGFDEAKTAIDNFFKSA